MPRASSTVPTSPRPREQEMSFPRLYGESECARQPADVSLGAQTGT